MLTERWRGPCSALGVGVTHSHEQPVVVSTKRRWALGEEEPKTSSPGEVTKSRSNCEGSSLPEARG